MEQKFEKSKRLFETSKIKLYRKCSKLFSLITQSTVGMKFPFREVLAFGDNFFSDIKINTIKCQANFISKKKHNLAWKRGAGSSYRKAWPSGILEKIGLLKEENSYQLGFPFQNGSSLFLFEKSINYNNGSENIRYKISNSQNQSNILLLYSHLSNTLFHLR